MIELTLYLIVMAVANRARGSQIFGLVSSTQISRDVGMFIMTAAIIAVAHQQAVYLSALIWCGLMLWCSPAWDNYWSAAIGNPTNVTKSTFAPVDWIMARLHLPVVTSLQLRTWGTIAMGLRGGVTLYPLFAALGFLGHPAAFLFGIATFLQGVPYLIAGIPANKAYSILFAELTWGAALGAIFAGALHVA